MKVTIIKVYFEVTLMVLHLEFKLKLRTKRFEVTYDFSTHSTSHDKITAKLVQENQRMETMQL